MEPRQTRPLALRGGGRRRETRSRDVVTSNHTDASLRPYRVPIPPQFGVRAARWEGRSSPHRTKRHLGRSIRLDIVCFVGSQTDLSTDARQTRRLLVRRRTAHLTLAPLASPCALSRASYNHNQCRIEHGFHPSQSAQCSDPIYFPSPQHHWRHPTNPYESLARCRRSRSSATDSRIARSMSLLHTRGRRLSAPTHGCFARRLPSDWHVRGHGITVR